MREASEDLATLSWAAISAVLGIGLIIAGVSTMQPQDWKNLMSPNLKLFGAIGFFLGGLVGFLLRPSALGVQLPFSDVITRGASLNGLDALLVGVARSSFNQMLAIAIVGCVAFVVVGYFIQTKSEER